MATVAPFYGLPLDQVAGWDTTPPYGSKLPGSGSPPLVVLRSPARVLSGGTGDYATFYPGFRGKVLAVLAHVTKDVVGAGATSTLKAQIDDVDVTGGVVTVVVDDLGDEVVPGTQVTAANTFGPGAKINLAQTQGVVATAGEAEVLLLCSNEG